MTPVAPSAAAIALGVALGGALLIGLMWAAVLYESRRIESERRISAETAVAAVATLGAEVLRGAMRSADLILIDLTDEWARDPASFDRRVRRRQSNTGDVLPFDVKVIGPDGRALYSSVSASQVGADFSMRPVVRAHAEQRARGLVIAEPVWERLPGRVSVPISRRIEGPAGSTSAVIVLTFSPAVLARNFEQLDLRPDWVVTAVHDEGASLFRAVVRAVPGEPRNRLQTEGEPTSAGIAIPRPGTPSAIGFPAEGIGIIGSPIDTVERLYAWRRAADYPVTLIVGRPAASLRADIAAARRTLVAFGVLGTIALVVLSYGVFGFVRLRAEAARRQALQLEQLTRSEEALRASQDELLALNSALTRVREEEARRIAQEIHDDLGQRLTVLRLEIAMLPRALAGELQERLPARVAALKAEVDRAISAVRDISQRLRPASLEAGLAEAVDELRQEFEASSGVRFQVQTRLPARPLPDPVSVAAYRIIQECVTNAIRHARPRDISILVAAHDEALRIEVRDDGSGFDPTARGARGRLGIAGMRHRAEALGGSLEVRSTPDAGTRVIAVLPLGDARATGQA